MSEKTKRTRRVVTVRRTLAVGTIAATALGTTALSAAENSDAGDLVKLAQVKSEGAPSAEGEGEGEGAAADPCFPAAGEGEGVGEASAAASDGEGEGEAAAASGEGEASVTASGEGEGETTAASGEGEGEAASAGEGEGEGEAVVAGGEGEAEGGAVSLDPAVCLSRDLDFMEGHLRAGIALYEAGDLKAAKTHMGHPIEEKYDAVSEPLAERGYGRLKDELNALAEAAEAGMSIEDVQPLYSTVVGTIEEVRDQLPAKDQLLGMALLTRVAADEYTVAVEGGEVSNLHEYQDSWGFLRVVEAEAGELADSDDRDVAEAADKVLQYLAATDAAYGDIQGEGEFEMNPSLLYGAAARMELAAKGLK